MGDMGRVHRRWVGRFAIGAVVCVLLGVVTTVGVAWGIASSADASQIRTSQNDWPPADLDADGDSVQWCYVPGLRWTQTTDSVPPDQARVDQLRAEGKTITHTGSVGMACRMDAGWPWLATSSRTGYAVQDAVPPWQLRTLQEGLAAPRGWRAIYPYLPCMPIWPGFALDMAVYAATWSLLLFTPVPLYRAGRRRFRVSRGMCGSCGYDLRGSTGSVCPECGA